MSYPRMIYRDGVLSSNPANQRIVHDEETELAAMADGFSAWDGKSKEVPGSGATVTNTEAQQVAFEAAATKPADDDEGDGFPKSDRKPGVAPGRKPKA